MVYGRTDHYEAARGRGGSGPGENGQVSKQIGVSEQTYYRRRKEYGGLRIDQAKRLKTLEKENARLKKRVPDLSWDKQILKEVASGNF